MGKGEGFGKTILVGDAFIQYGVPAIVAAIPQKTVVSIEFAPGKGWEVEDNPMEIPGYKESKLAQREESIERILKFMKINFRRQKAKIELKGDLLAGSGVGASAASCVALARALNDELGLGLDHQAINRIAFEGEKGYHGKPGGVDNTASTFGGILYFQLDLKSNEEIVEKLDVRDPIHLVLANCGVNVNTAKVVSDKKKQVVGNPDKYEKIFTELTNQAKNLRTALACFDLFQVGEIMDAHHHILRKLNFSHPKLEILVALAKAQGALGAKLTGGGKGGYMVALADDSSHQYKIAQSIEREGFRTLPVSIGK